MIGIIGIVITVVMVFERVYYGSAARCRDHMKALQFEMITS